MSTMSKKLKIYIDGEVLVLPHFSGIGHYTLELVRALDRAATNDQTISIVLGVHWRQFKKAKSFNFRNVRIARTPFSHRISNGLKIRQRQPYLDLLFGKRIYLFPNYSTWPLLYSKGVPFIYDLSFELYPQFAEPRNQKFLSDSVKISARRAAMIATISENSRNEILEYYHAPSDAVHIYYPAVDTTKYYVRGEKEVEAKKRKYGIAGKYILFVGNIEPRKNLKNLLLAYEALPINLRKTYSLLLVGGSGWQNNEINTIVRRLNSSGSPVIRPKRYVEDDELPALYSGASLFVYPSIYEGFGIPPLEAMACGTPTIVSDNSSLPEVVDDAAVMVKAQSVSGISEAMSLVLRDKKLQRQLIANGHRQVRKFSWDKSAQSLLDDLRKL